VDRKTPPFFKPKKSEASRKRSLAQISLAAYPIFKIMLK
jgi:hypothetical protein